uniref:Uncharacterized protein n=1 Tax=Panagrolaimus sp. JU765 TaxID=591449 RepID=A0AC34QG56_9BILA
MEEEHYDTPWEYKNKFLNALKPRPVSSNILPSTSTFENDSRNQQHKSMLIRPNENNSPLSSPSTGKLLKRSPNLKDETRRRRSEHGGSSSSSSPGSGPDYPFVKNTSGSSRLSHGLLKKFNNFNENELIHPNIGRAEAEQLLMPKSHEKNVLTEKSVISTGKMDDDSSNEQECSSSCDDECSFSEKYDCCKNREACDDLKPASKKYFIGVYPPSKVSGFLRPTEFVLYYRRPEAVPSLDEIPVCLPLTIAYMSCRGAMYHFGVKQGQGANGLPTIRVVINDGPNNEPCFCSMKALISYYETYGVLKKNGDLELFSIPD